MDSAGVMCVTRVERIRSDRFQPSVSRATVKDYYSRLNPSLSKAGESSSQSDGPPGLPPDCLCVLGPLIEHLKAFGIERVMARPRLQPFATAVSMTLDGVTLRDLEVRQGYVGSSALKARKVERDSILTRRNASLTYLNQRQIFAVDGREQGSLFALLNHTITPFGNRR